MSNLIEWITSNGGSATISEIGNALANGSISPKIEYYGGDQPQSNPFLSDDAQEIQKFLISGDVISNGLHLHSNAVYSVTPEGYNRMGIVDDTGRNKTSD